jgi:hypothetical protein
MIKRIEQWLRRVIVVPLECSLHIDTLTNSERHKHLLDHIDEERQKYIAEMRGILTADLKQFRADLVAERLLVAEPQHWKADADEVKQQRELIHPKPTRR